MISIKNNTCHTAAPGKLHTAEGRSCFELGVCQGRKPACSGCSWQLAPGVIDGPYKRLRRDPFVRACMRWVPWALGASAVVGAAVGVAYRLGWL